MAFSTTNSIAEPRKFSLGPKNLQIMNWSASPGDVTGTIIADRMSLLQELAITGLTLTSKPVYSGNQATITFKDPGGASPLLPDTNLLTAGNFALLASTAVTSTGGTIVKGDLGIYAGTAITGFPPGVVTGVTHTADAAANQAQTDLAAAIAALSAPSTMVIASALDGQALTAGYYSFASGACTLAQSGNGTLTFNGSATDVFVIKTATTVTTGAGGIPTIAFTGGALPQNVYWVIGSSATINSGVTSAGATFYGNILAHTSITVTQASNVVGRLLANTGAVTLSAAVNVAPTASGASVFGEILAFGV